jgi:hypothetical protein
MKNYSIRTCLLVTSFQEHDLIFLSGIKIRLCVGSVCCMAAVCGGLAFSYGGAARAASLSISGRESPSSYLCDEPRKALQSAKRCRARANGWTMACRRARRESCSTHNRLCAAGPCSNVWRVVRSLRSGLGLEWLTLQLASQCACGCSARPQPLTLAIYTPTPCALRVSRTSSVVVGRLSPGSEHY